MVKTIEQYLQSNPDASLKEYQDYVKEQTRKDSTETFENLRKCQEWYNMLTGRYFLINFNNTAFRAVYIDKLMEHKSHKLFMMYCIVVDENEYAIEYKNMYLNPEWFSCPYDSSSGKGVEEIREISEGEYNAIVAQYQKVQDVFYKMKLK